MSNNQHKTTTGLFKEDPFREHAFMYLLDAYGYYDLLDREDQLNFMAIAKFFEICNGGALYREMERIRVRGQNARIAKDNNGQE